MPTKGIYKITSPSGRIYIGQSTNIEIRWYKYKKLHCLSQTRLYNSLKKYGYEHHIFEIIEKVDQSELRTKEKYYIETYKNLGYNLLNMLSGDELRRSWVPYHYRDIDHSDKIDIDYTIEYIDELSLNKMLR